MRRASALPLPAAPTAASRGDWQTVRSLLPYLLEYKGRVALALTCLVAAKLANVGVPLLLKQIVDRLTVAPSAQPLVLPVALLVAYGALRLSTTAFTELREYLFAKVTQRTVRTVALKTFRHLHELSLRFHLARQTGGLTRDVERGTRGISTLIGYALFSILPTLIEIALVSAILVARYDVWFIGITLGALCIYIVYTITITEWRTGFRRQMNELDSRGQHARDRQSAQLRDRQVFQQRAIRGVALRRKPAALGDAPRCAARPRCRCSTSARARSSPSR